MAHGFFAGLLAGGLGTPDQARGRFRSYLLGAVKHFLAKYHEAAMAWRRGGGVEHVALEDDSNPDLPIPSNHDEMVFIASGLSP